MQAVTFTSDDLEAYLHPMCGFAVVSVDVCADASAAEVARLRQWLWGVTQVSRDVED
jgi:hypothetical protein